MNRLNSLINRLCPDGVVYFQLSHLADIGTGRHNTNEGLNEGEFPFFVRSQEVRRLNDYDYDEAAIITSGDGVGVGKIFHYINGKYALHQRAYRIHITDSRLNVRFLFHYMKANFFEYIQKTAVNSSVTSVRRPMLNRYPVPVPPMEVQREIVRILDSFTLLTEELTTKLTAELTARKKQYEYYRDMLLVPPCDDVENIPLSDVVNIKNGKDYKHLKDGKYPVYGSGGIMTYKSEYTYDKPSVLIPRKGSLSNLFYVEEPFWNVDTVFYTEINESKLIPKYLYYLLQKEHLESLNTAGGVPSLTQSVLNKLNLTIPSLNRQRKIVDCLDNFEKICNDLNIGLPAEIEARRKQYEYYRDVLLTFAETGSTILADRQTDRQ
ncbi:restriction endonuclease subunit S [Lachnoanaerobaculum gingivalis]